jgi:hypothetical protein
MGWHPQGLFDQISTQVTKRVACRHTEVLGALLDHTAVNLPQPIAGIDNLGGVRDDLVTTDDILR